MSVWNGNYQSPNWSGNTTTNSKNLVVSSIQTNYISTGKLYAGDAYISSMTINNVNISTLNVSTITANSIKASTITSIDVNSSNVNIYGYTGSALETPHPPTLNFITSTATGIVTTTLSATEDGISNSGTLTNNGDGTFNHDLTVLGVLNGTDIYANNITASNDLTGSNLTAEVAQIQDGYGTASLSIYGTARVNPLNALYVEGNTQIYHRLKVSDSTYGIADLNVYGANHIVGDNALYVEGGTTLTGGGVIHGVTLGALQAAGIDTVRLEVLPGGIYLTTVAPVPIAINSLAAVTINAGGAANVAAGGALSLAGGDYVEINTSAIKCINTTNPGCNVLNVDTIFPSQTVTGSLNRFNLNQISTAEISTIVNTFLSTSIANISTLNVNTISTGNIQYLLPSTIKVSTLIANSVSTNILSTNSGYINLLTAPIANISTLNVNTISTGNIQYLLPSTIKVSTLIANSVSTNILSTNVGYINLLTAPTTTTNAINSYSSGNVSFLNDIVLNNHNLLGVSNIQVSSMTSQGIGTAIAVLTAFDMKQNNINNVNTVTTSNIAGNGGSIQMLNTIDMCNHNITNGALLQITTLGSTTDQINVNTNLNMTQKNISNVSSVTTNQSFVSTLIVDNVTGNTEDGVNFLEAINMKNNSITGVSILNTNQIATNTTTNVSFFNDIVLNNHNLTGVSNIQISSITSGGINTNVAVLTSFDMKQNNISNVNILIASNISTNNLSTNIGYINSLTSPTMSTNRIASYNTGSVAFPNAIVMCNQNIFQAKNIELSSITSQGSNIALFTNIDMKQNRISNVSSVTTNQSFVSTLIVDNVTGNTEDGVNFLAGINMKNNNITGIAVLNTDFIAANTATSVTFNSPVIASNITVSIINGFNPPPPTIGSPLININSATNFMNHTVYNIDVLAMNSLFANGSGAPIYILSDFHMSNHSITNANNISGSNVNALNISTGNISSSHIVASLIDGFPTSPLNATPLLSINSATNFLNHTVYNIDVLAMNSLFANGSGAPIYVLSDFHMSNHSITNANNISASNVNALNINTISGTAVNFATNVNMGAHTIYNVNTLTTTFLNAPSGYPVYLLSDLNFGGSNIINNVSNVIASNISVTNLNALNINTTSGTAVNFATNVNMGAHTIYNVNTLTTTYLNAPSGYPIYIFSPLDFGRSNFLSNVSTIYLNSGTSAPLSVSADGQTLQLNGSNIGGGGGGGWTPIATSDLDMKNYSIFSTNILVASNINISDTLTTNNIESYTGATISVHNNIGMNNSNIDDVTSISFNNGDSGVVANIYVDGTANLHLEAGGGNIYSETPITTSNNITISGNDAAKAELILSNNNTGGGAVSFYVDDGGNMIQSCTTGGASYFIRNTGGSGGKITMDYSGIGDADIVIQNIGGQGILTLSNYNHYPILFPDGINVNYNNISNVNTINFNVGGDGSANIYYDGTNLNFQADGGQIICQTNMNMNNNNISNVSTINFNLRDGNANIYIDTGNNLNLQADGGQIIFQNAITSQNAITMLGTTTEGSILPYTTTIFMDTNNALNIANLNTSSIVISNGIHLQADRHDSTAANIFMDVNDNLNLANETGRPIVISNGIYIQGTDRDNFGALIYTDTHGNLNLSNDSADAIKILVDVDMNGDSIVNVGACYVDNIYKNSGSYITIASPTLFTGGIGLQGKSMSNISSLGFLNQDSPSRVGILQYLNEGTPGDLYHFSGTAYGGLDIASGSLYNVANLYVTNIGGSTYSANLNMGNHIISNVNQINVDYLSTNTSNHITVKGNIDMFSNVISNVAGLYVSTIYAYGGTITNFKNHISLQSNNISNVANIVMNPGSIITEVTYMAFVDATNTYNATISMPANSLALSNTDGSKVWFPTGINMSNTSISNVNTLYTTTINSTGTRVSDLWVTNINGSAYSGNSWIGTATSDLNMAGYNISNVPTIYTSNITGPSGGSTYAPLKINSATSFQSNAVSNVKTIAMVSDATITNVTSINTTGTRVGDLWVTNINGASYPPPLVWDPTATSGLDMAGYDITNVNHITSISSITSNVFIKTGSTLTQQPFIQRGNFQVNHTTATETLTAIIFGVSYNNYDYAVYLTMTWDVGSTSTSYDRATPLPVVVTQSGNAFSFYYTPSLTLDYRINWTTIGYIT